MNPGHTELFEVIHNVHIDSIVPSLVKIFCTICGFQKNLALIDPEKGVIYLIQLDRLLSETQCGIVRIGHCSTIARIIESLFAYKEFESITCSLCL